MTSVNVLMSGLVLHYLPHFLQEFEASMIQELVVAVVPPVSVESAGSLLLLALVLQAAVEVVSLVMLSLLDAACSVAEVGCLCLVAVGSVMHSQLLSVVVVELVE